MFEVITMCDTQEEVDRIKNLGLDSKCQEVIVVKAGEPVYADAYHAGDDGFSHFTTFISSVDLIMGKSYYPKDEEYEKMILEMQVEWPHCITIISEEEYKKATYVEKRSVADMTNHFTIYGYLVCKSNITYNQMLESKIEKYCSPGEYTLKNGLTFDFDESLKREFVDKDGRLVFEIYLNKITLGESYPKTSDEKEIFEAIFKDELAEIYIYPGENTGPADNGEYAEYEAVEFSVSYEGKTKNFIKHTDIARYMSTLSPTEQVEL